MPLYTGENNQPPRDYKPNPNDVISRNLAADAREDRILAGAGAAWGAKRVADQWVRTSPTYDPSRGLSQIFDKPVSDIKDTVTAFRNRTNQPNVNFNPDPYRGMAPGNHPQLGAPATSKALIPATQRISTDYSSRVADPRFSTKNRLKSTWKGVAGSGVNKLLALAVPYKLYQAHKTDELRRRYLNKEMSLQEVNRMRYDRGIVGATKTAGTVDTFKGAHNMPRVAGVPSASNSTPAAPKMKTASDDNIVTTPLGMASIAMGAATGSQFGKAVANHKRVLKRRDAIMESRDLHNKIRDAEKAYSAKQALWYDQIANARPGEIDGIMANHLREIGKHSENVAGMQVKKMMPDLERKHLRTSGHNALIRRNKYLKRGAGLLAGTAALGAYSVHDFKKKHQEKTAADNAPAEVTPLSMASTAAGVIGGTQLAGAGLMHVADKAIRSTPYKDTFLDNIARKQRDKFLRNGALFTAGALGLGAYNRWRDNQTKTAAHEDDVATFTLNKRDAAAKGAVGLASASAGALFAAADSQHDLMTTRNLRKSSVHHAKRVGRDYRANQKEWDAIQSKIQDKRQKLFDLKMETDMFTPEGKAEYERLRGLGEKLDNIESKAHKAYLSKDSDLFQLKSKLKYERKLNREILREATKTRKNALIGAGVSGAAALGLGAYALHNHDTQE